MKVTGQDLEMLRERCDKAVAAHAVASEAFRQATLANNAADDYKVSCQRSLEHYTQKFVTSDEIDETTRLYLDGLRCEEK